VAKNERGFFSFVLHGHIPYCRKAGVWPFGEEWVLEAMAETYIPLLNLLYKLRDSEKHFKLTMGFTPVLLEQISDEYMIERFQEYAQSRIKLAREDVKRFESCNDGMLKDLASFYEEYYISILKMFQEKFKNDLVGAFRRLQDDGVLEIIASVATHGYLPLMDAPSIYAQMKVGIDTYERHFHRRPRGIWLPECGYRPDGGDLEDLMEKLDIEYFFVDTLDRNVVDPDCRIIIYPSILFAIKVDDIKNIYDKLQTYSDDKKISSEEGEVYEGAN
jgi:1,4-alpha-glucan branching enzyme